MSDDLVKRLRDWEHVWPDDMDKPAGHLYDDAADRIEELEAENHLLKNSGIVEVAVRNPNVMEYMRHWEGRAEAAEAKLAKAVEALRWQADIINDSLTGNEVGKHRILLDGEYHEGPVVNWVHKILTGFEHINRATLAELTGGKDE